MESPIISVMTTTMIATGSATRSPEKMLGIVAGKMTRRKIAAQAEIARHHDRIEALEKGECDLRRRSDAEYIGENGKQGDLRYRIADEENRLEQIAHERGPRHRAGEWNSNERREQEAGESPRNRDACVIDERPAADFRRERGPNPPRARKQTGFHETARDRHLPNQKQQWDRVPTPNQRPGLREGLSAHRTTSSSVPIIWPLSRRDR